MNKIIISFFLLIAGFVHTPVSRAAQNLYATEVPVADASPDARKAAIRQAFEQVLVKASGYRDLNGRSGMKDLLKDAGNHVQQFRYKTGPGGEDGTEQRRLWVAFEKNMVQKALRKLGLSVWEQGRPQVLVWLARENKGRRSLVDPEQNAGLLQALRDAAARRGLPLLMPLMDLQDQSSLRVSDIWTADRESIEKASSRYASPVVLSGRLRQKGGQWQARWTLFLADLEKTFDSAGADEASAAIAGLDKVMDWLASRYVPAVDSESAESVKVRFLNVRSLEDYSMVMSLLESLDALSGLAVQASSADQLLVQAQVRGGRDILVQRLSLEADLTPVASIPDEESTEPDLELTYRLR
ncbi:DUF2066 domain-containing protein [Thiolapillus brandeum]|uniref:DUF2066 domain-containing protein n=1 Tax=Thiolapillus brandeum TaxID=1076588 RepID=A0A7U6GKA6_9GAMM|nr:DUF2066 domain-containing protein [Thiolapillus brandeum]BAO45196.1 conserved hypothetical protein [Thiolapillus brandeum]